MRCSICGRQTRYHHFGHFALVKKGENGRLVQTSNVYQGSKCGAIMFFQTHMLLGMGELRRVKV